MEIVATRVEYRARNVERFLPIGSKDEGAETTREKRDTTLRRKDVTSAKPQKIEQLYSLFFFQIVMRPFNRATFMNSCTVFIYAIAIYRNNFVRATKLFLMTFGIFSCRKSRLQYNIHMYVSPVKFKWANRTLRSRLLYVPTRRVIIARDRLAQLFFFSRAIQSDHPYHTHAQPNQAKSRRESCGRIDGNRSPFISTCVDYNCARGAHKIPLVLQLASRDSRVFNNFFLPFMKSLSSRADSVAAMYLNR